MNDGELGTIYRSEIESIITDAKTKIENKTQTELEHLKDISRYDIAAGFIELGLLLAAAFSSGLAAILKKLAKILATTALSAVGIKVKDGIDVPEGI